MQIVLSERQRGILRRVVEEFVATGQPVGSKTLVERAALGVSPSTVRNELAELERLGLLTHPHTSAGRVPTEAGYRLYVDEDRKSTRLNSSHMSISYAVFCLKKKIIHSF